MAKAAEIEAHLQELQMNDDKEDSEHDKKGTDAES